MLYEGIQGLCSCVMISMGALPFSPPPPLQQVISVEPPNTPSASACSACALFLVALCLPSPPQVISVEPPNTVELEVVETDPGVKGNTAVSMCREVGESACRKLGECVQEIG